MDIELIKFSHAVSSSYLTKIISERNILLKNGDKENIITKSIAETLFELHLDKPTKDNSNMDPDLMFQTYIMIKSKIDEFLK